MKIIRVITVFIFTFILLLPVVFFNFDEDAVSVIDNRMLAPNPFVESDENFQTRLSNYISDRNKFREIMIRTYNVWNDRLFNVMTQPGFVYGKDGQVFGHGITTGNDYGRLQDAFAEMVVKINDYCDERDIPFLFVVEPAKPAVYTDELPDGINYDRQWVDMLMDNLRLNGVPVLDNAVTMRRLREEGIEPYNRMFDPNHWNAMGAFYGSAEILSRLFEQYPGIHINDLSEFTLSYRHMDTLTGSANFPIDEDVPVLTPVLRGVHTITDEYEGLQIDPHYNKFEYYINPTRLEEGGPRVMVFQGSYFNGVDDVYFQNAFGEYICIHNYMNVVNFPYYFNIFQPDCVVFEVAEYAVNRSYFNRSDMHNAQYNPPLGSVPADDLVHVNPETDDIAFEQSGALTTVTWSTDEVYDHVWAVVEGTEYDMIPTDGGYYFAYTGGPAYDIGIVYEDS